MQVTEISPETSAKLSNVGRKYFRFIEFDDKEVLIREIRKHPIGLFFIYASGIFVSLILVLLFGVFTLSSDVSSIFNDTGVSSSSASAVIALVGFLVIALIIVATTIQVILYVNNVIFVTNEKIAQILYINIFHRKISQLSVGDVQDVTVTQKGILAHFFNYGTLVLETAGEQQNYTFTYVPDPYIASKDIVNAHEQNLVQFGN